jgi:hypothetical protein
VITFLLISKFGIQNWFFSTEAIVQTYFDKINAAETYNYEKKKLKLKSVSGIKCFGSGEVMEA